MLYISLIVHEAPDVIYDQLANFRRFAPSATIVVHVSRSLAISSAELARLESLGSVLINPTRVNTIASSLLQPHLVNIEYILSLCSSDEDRVAFHASNDMFVRSGVEEFVQRYDAAYYSDGVLDLINEPKIASAALADPVFVRMCNAFGVKTIIKTQIEGAFFQVRHLRAIRAVLASVVFDWEKPRDYFAEEIVLSTLIHAELAGTGARVGVPYVLSEVAMKMKYIEARHRLLGYNLLARVLGRCLRTIGPNRMTIRLVMRLISGNLGWYQWFSKSLGVRRFHSDECFAVKRVNRDINDPLRLYIRSLAA